MKEGYTWTRNKPSAKYPTNAKDRKKSENRRERRDKRSAKFKCLTLPRKNSNRNNIKDLIYGKDK